MVLCQRPALIFWMTAWLLRLPDVATICLELYTPLCLEGIFYLIILRTASCTRHRHYKAWLERLNQYLISNIWQKYGSYDVEIDQPINRMNQSVVAAWFWQLIRVYCNTTNTRNNLNNTRLALCEPRWQHMRVHIEDCGTSWHHKYNNSRLIQFLV